MITVSHLDVRESENLIRASDMNVLWTRQVVFSYWGFRRENSQPEVAVCIIYKKNI